MNLGAHKGQAYYDIKDWSSDELMFSIYGVLTAKKTTFEVT